MEEMVMDAKEIQSDLYSLKRLYGLVKSGSSNIESDVALDGRARLVLKNLLDAATKSVFKIVSGQEEAPQTVSPAVRQHNEFSEDCPIPSQYASTNAGLSRNVQKELVGSKKDKKPDGCSILLWNEKSFATQSRQAGSLDEPIQNVPASGHEHRTRRCRVCQRNTVKQLETKEGTRFYHSNSFSSHYVWNSDLETGLSPKDGNEPFERNFNGNEFRGFPTDRIATDFAKVCWSDNDIISKPQEVDLLSKEASKAIEQIESGISAFHLGADPLHLIEGRSAQPQNSLLKAKSEGRIPHTQCGAVPSLYMSQNEERYMYRNDWQYDISSQRVEKSAGHTLHQAPCVAAEETYPAYLSMNQTPKLVQPTRAMREQQSIMSNFINSRGQGLGNEASSEVREFPNAILSKLESGNWMVGYNNVPNQNQIQGVQNVPTAMNPNETSYTSNAYPAAYPSVSGMVNRYQSHAGVEDDTRRYRLLQTSMPMDSFMNLNDNETIQLVDPNPNFSSSSGAPYRTYPSTVIDADIDKKLSQPSLHPGFYQARKDTGRHQKDGISQNRNHVTGKRMVLPPQESDFTADSYTSTWRSEQTSSLYSAGESEEYSLPENSRETEYVISASSETGTGNFYTSSTYDSDDQSYYSPNRGTTFEESSSSCRRSVECSSMDRPINHHAGATHNFRSTSKRLGPRKTLRSSDGRKNQWGTWKRLKDKLAVIFHHHHHHHYNHDNHDNGRKKKTGNVILQKQREKEARAERDVEKTRKSVILDKKQQSQFRGLMGGFLSHVRKPKESKQGKETVSQIAKSQQYGRKKALQKPNFSRLLQQHKGGKLPSKTLPNLGFAKKKTHLKGLPHI